MMWLRTAGARLASASAAAARQNARAAPIAFFSSSSSASSATAVGSTTTPKVNITNVVTPKRHRTAVTNLIWQKRGELGSQSSASDSLAVPHSLLPKTMHDSYMVTMLPFREDESLRDDYVNVSGNLRVGKLLEDLDAFAGSVAYLHCDDLNDASRPLTIVTASVDHIFLLKTLRADRNVRMRGHVTWVGRSSMEVTIAVEAEGEGEGAWDKLMYATFVMVARDAKTNKSHLVNPLQLSGDPAEKQIFDASDARMGSKKAEQQRSLQIEAPTPEESRMMHKLYLAGLNDKRPCVSMSDTSLSTTHLCFPQERNIHGKLFGGYLMRSAFELAFCNAAIFSGATPLFVAQDDIAFRKPVEIGSVLLFSSRIVLCEGAPHSTMQVQVSADVVDPATGARDTTNVFHFTFRSGKELRPVIPRTYEECVTYIAGLRRRQASMKLKRSKHVPILPVPGRLVWL